MSYTSIRVDFKQYTVDMDFPVKAFMGGTCFIPALAP